MEGRPPQVPKLVGYDTDQSYTPSKSGPISKPYGMNRDAFGQGSGGRLTPHDRTSSRGSIMSSGLGDDTHMYISATKNMNPMGMSKMRTAVERDEPSTPNRVKGQQNSYRPMDANNPLEYGADDNLRKLRNDVYRKHNYGQEANDPFSKMNLEDMNDDDMNERRRIKALEDEISRNKIDIEKSKMKLEKKQLYDLYEKETRLVDRLGKIFIFRMLIK
jgi:hypothetical protein